MVTNIDSTCRSNFSESRSRHGPLFNQHLCNITIHFNFHFVFVNVNGYLAQDFQCSWVHPCIPIYNFLAENVHNYVTQLNFVIINTASCFNCLPQNGFSLFYNISHCISIEPLIIVKFPPFQYFQCQRDYQVERPNRHVSL